MAKSKKPIDSLSGDDENPFVEEHEVQRMTKEEWAASQIDSQPEPSPVEDDKLVDIHTTPNTVTIEYESEGRFSIPAKLQWSNWVYEHIHDITLSNPEDRLENIISALEKLKAEDSEFAIQNMTAEELFETLIGIKLKFQGPTHIHRWMCECQNDLDDGDKQGSEEKINLKTLNYVSATDAENNLRQFVKTRLEKLPKEHLKTYFKRQAKDSTLDWENMTIDDFVSRVEFKEPFFIHSADGKKYEFRWKRVKDLIRAKEIADREFDFKVKEMKRKRWNNQGSLADFKAKQEENVKALNQKKGKAIILYASALSLMKVNGKELSEQERILEYKRMDPKTLKAYVDYLDATKHGVQDEREYTCNLCGKTTGRSERGNFGSITNLLSLLPIDVDSNDNLGELEESYLFFGV